GEDRRGGHEGRGKGYNAGGKSGGNDHAGGRRSKSARGGDQPQTRVVAEGGGRRGHAANGNDGGGAGIAGARDENGGGGITGGDDGDGGGENGGVIEFIGL